MKLVVEVRAGPDAGRSFVIEPGSEVIVGRSAPAQLVLAGDSTVSRRHFALVHDGRECRIRDLGSSHGTTVNGARIESVVVTPGDVVGAGTTLLRVRFAADAPTGAAAVATTGAPLAAGGAEATDEHAVIDSFPYDRIVEILRSQTAPLYAVLDAARDPVIYQRVHECEEKKQSLYEGPQAVELSFIAPYLIALPKESPFLERLVREAWGKSWGLYLTCEKPFEDLRKDLRRFLTVEIEGRGKALFRYYDPRVLRHFLPTCRPEEVRDFFRDVRSYLCERGDGGLERFSIGSEGLSRASLPLESLALWTAP